MAIGFPRLHWDVSRGPVPECGAGSSQLGGCRAEFGICVPNLGNGRAPAGVVLAVSAGTALADLPGPGTASL